MKILKLKRKTAGGLHGWYETDMGFEVRKPLGQMIYEKPTPLIIPKVEPIDFTKVDGKMWLFDEKHIKYKKDSWYKRLWNAIKKIIHGI